MMCNRTLPNNSGMFGDSMNMVFGYGITCFVIANQEQPRIGPGGKSDSKASASSTMPLSQDKPAHKSDHWRLARHAPLAAYFLSVGTNVGRLHEQLRLDAAV